jgi:hypothetical protein
MALKSLGRGVWIDPEMIESVVATGPTTEFGHPVEARVAIHCRHTAPMWTFESYEKAIEFATWIAGQLSLPVAGA